MRRRRKWFIAGVLLGCLLPCAASGEGVDTTRARPLEGVVVRGRVTGLDVSSPVPSRSLSGERLERLNSLSVADAARYLSGVQLKDYGGIGGLKTVDARGLGSAHVAVFYDGMPVGNVQNGQVDLGRFLLENVEEIELYSAQQPSLLQPARGLFASSVLLLRGKMPKFEEGRRWRATAGVKGGSFGLVNPSASWQQRLGRRAAFSAAVNYLKADGRYRFRYTNGTYDTTIVRRNGDVETAHAEAGVHVSLDEGTLLTAKGYFHGSSRGLPGAIVAGRFSNAQRQADRTFFLQLSLRREREGRRTMVGAKWSGDRGRYEDPDYLVPGGLVNVFRQEEWYASAVHAREVARWLEVSLAVDASRQGLRSNVASFPDPSRVSLWGAVSARAWWERLTVQGNLLACGAWERVKRGRKPGAHRVFCPVVSLSWQPTRSPGLRTRFFYKRSFRLPTFNDIYYVYPIVVALRPEFTTQYNAGVAWVRERAGRLVAAVEVQGDVYYNRVRDKIVGFPSGNIGRWTMVNLGRATVTGVEVNGRVALAPGTVGVDAGVTYTWQRAVDATPGDTRGCRVPYVPEHAGTATVAASRGAWRLNYSFIYTGERFSRRDNAREGREAAWCTHDVSLGYRRGVLRVDAEVNNVLNRYYSVVRGYPMPGRSWRLGLSIMI